MDTYIGDSFFAAIGLTLWKAMIILGAVLIPSAIIVTVIANLADRPHIDPHRVCVTGTTQYPDGPPSPNWWSDGSGDC